MKRIMSAMFVGFMVSSVAVLQAQQPVAAAPDSAIMRAKDFVGLLSKGEYAACVGFFDSTMTAVLSAEKLKESWDTVLVRVGPFKKQLRAWSQKYRLYDIVLVTCLFEKDSADVRVVLNEKKQVAGLFYAKPVPPIEYKAPAYVNRESFREEEVLVGKGRWALHGTLTIPKSPSPCPAVVLVHGSGPNDRDETIGPNKPFRDLAWGLASRGIAVLRYEKRTKEHGQELVVLKQTFTVKEEAIEDALLAVELLRRTNGISPEQIHVLGHSLGGMLAPRIGVGDPALAGLIILAGASRPLEDIMVEQIAYLGSSGDLPPQKQLEQLSNIEKERDKVKKLTKADTSSVDSYFAAPASYWIDLQGYDPPQLAASLRMPMLILQGERDYQVTMKDYERWKDALRGNKNVSFELYPELNHLFIAGAGKSIPAEYGRAGHVQDEVVEDIARWINAPKK
ncbi:MAG: alpha/beta fold hydrolase [Ignavibacteriales bacterium]|nr:alpha/beta fold hydrolase [Ignavibacteriales bacterium]